MTVEAPAGNLRRRRNHQSRDQTRESESIDDNGSGGQKTQATAFAVALQATFVAVVAAAVFSNTLDGEWAFDDRFAVTENADVMGADLAWGDLLWRHDFWGQDLARSDSHKSWRPLTTLSFRLQARAQADQGQGRLGSLPATRPFHVANLALHACATGVLVVVVHQLYAVVGGPADATAMLLGRRSRVAIGAGLLFAVHPVHVESVASIVGRADVLACLLSLLGLVLYCAMLRCHVDGHWSLCWTAGSFFASLGCGIAATAAKELGLASFAAMLAVDLVHARRRSGFNSGWAARALALISCVGAYVSLRKFLMVELDVTIFRHLENPIALAQPRLVRGLSIAHLHAFYLSLLLLPTSFCADYSFDAIPLVVSLTDPRLVWTAASYVAVAALVVWAAIGALVRAESAAAFVFVLVAWAGAAFLPFSNLIFYVGTMVGERLLYIPSAAFCAVVAWVALGRSELDRSRLKAGVGFVAVVLVAIWWGSTAWDRNKAWENEEELFWAAAANPTCARSAKVQLHVGILHRRYERWGAALEAFAAARAIEPSYCEVDYWEGRTRLDLDEAPAAVALLWRAMECPYVVLEAGAQLMGVYEKLIAWRPADIAYRTDMIKVAFKVNDFGRVALHAAAALEIDPGNAEAAAAVRILEALAGATTAAKGKQ